MGLDLTLLPMMGAQQMDKKLVVCRERLTFDGDCKILRQLENFDEDSKPTIETNSIPPQMWVRTYEHNGIMPRRHDELGRVLTFAYARELKKLEVADDSTNKNKAIKAFVEKLSDDTPIILLWH